MGSFGLCRDLRETDDGITQILAEFALIAWISPYGRLDLNHPPTAGAGTRGVSKCRASGRLDLNDPPTAVGGIRGFRSVVLPVGRI